MARLTYDPDVFEQSSLQDARRLILTPEGMDSEERWRTETPYVVTLIIKQIDVTADMLILDFGCGIGRLAKELIERCRCKVIGVDISSKMRAMATDYVGSPHFVACAPSIFESMIASGLRVDAALAVWVLQHCFNTAKDIETIGAALKPNARLFVLNNTHRAVPTKELKWVDDQVDVKAALAARFSLLREGRVPKETIAPDLALLHFWAVFANKTMPPSRLPT